MSRKALVSLVLALAVIFAIAAYQLFEKPNTEVKIGAILPLSGNGASYGKNMQNGIELSLAQERNQGASAVKVIYEDTRLDPSAAVTAFRRLVSVDDVPVVLGPFTSSQMMAVGPIAQQQKRVLISATATSPAISSIGDFVFRIIPSDTYDGRVVANLILAQFPKAKRVALVIINNDYGAGIRDAFSKVSNGLGLVIAGEFQFPPGTTDFRVMLQRINTLNPDVIFLVGYKEMGRFLRQKKELSINKIPVVSTGLMEDPEIVKIAQGGAEGVLYSYPSFNPDSGRGYVSAFVSAFKDQYGKKPDVIAALGYDLANIIQAALKNATSTSPQDIRDYLFSIKNFPGVAGNITFNSDGDVQKTSGVKVIKNGNFQWITETLSIPKE